MQVKQNQHLDELATQKQMYETKKDEFDRQMQHEREKYEKLDHELAAEQQKNVQNEQEMRVLLAQVRVLCCALARAGSRG